MYVHLKSLYYHTLIVQGFFFFTIAHYFQGCSESVLAEMSGISRGTYGDGNFIVVEDQSGVNAGELGYGGHFRCWILSSLRWMPKFDGASRRIVGLSFW